MVFKPQYNRDGVDHQTLELREMFERSKELERGEGYHPLHNAFLVSAHSFVGGARAKAVAAINLETQEVYLGNRNKVPPKGFIPVIIKYDDTHKDDEKKSTYSKLEYVYYLLATEAGIEMSKCYLLKSGGKQHFVTERFDMDRKGKRYHVHSLAGLLHTDYNIPRETDYRALFRVAVRLNASGSLKQLFRQMLFNYFFVNQDDHSRNFSFMCDENFYWRATPGYDITFAKGEKQTVEHQLSCNGKPLSQITIDDVVEVAREFSVYKDDEELIKELLRMKDIRDEKLAPLMQQYGVPEEKYKQVLHATAARNLQGALDV